MEYIALKACYLAQSDSKRDQDKTRTTIVRAHEFLENHSQENMYTEQVKEMLRASYLTLMRSEINIITTQLYAYNWTKNKDVLDSASKRLAYLYEKYLPYVPETAKRLEEIENQIIQAGGTVSKKKIVEKPLLIARNKKNKEKSYLDSLKGLFIEENEDYFA